MTRATLILGPETRPKATKWVQNLPDGDVVEFRRPKRSTVQNNRMWAMLTDVATQVEWNGGWLDTDDWKTLFMDTLKHELRMVPAISGVGETNLGRSTSKLTVPEMSDLMMVIEVFGATHGVKFKETRYDQIKKTV